MSEARAFYETVRYMDHYEKALKKIAEISDGLEAREIATEALESGPGQLSATESQALLRKELGDG